MFWTGNLRNTEKAETKKNLGSFNVLKSAENIAFYISIGSNAI